MLILVILPSPYAPGSSAELPFILPARHTLQGMWPLRTETLFYLLQRETWFLIAAKQRRQRQNYLEIGQSEDEYNKCCMLWLKTIKRASLRCDCLSLPIRHDDLVFSPND